MTKFLRLKVSLLSLLLAACVTINVYFPAGAAEQAADQIIDSVIKGTGRSTAPSTTPPSTTPPSNTPPPTSRIDGIHDLWLARAAGHLLETLVSPAHAQQANIDVSSSEIRAITTSMQQRFPQLERFFNEGIIGLTANGLIDVRDISAAALPDRALVRRLVAEDNADRDALYKAIARANEHPEWEADIRRTFAQRWVERGAKPGWYFQDLDGNWKRR